ncbi:MAG TPA: MFS transporter [Blastocatellia bacterium]|nr:MFS transporter [Blastocatellia bacterium]
MSESRAFGAIYTSVAISYLGVGLVAPLIALVLDERGANSFVVGLVGTTMFAAFTLASFPAGAATDRYGPRPVLTAGLVLYGTSVLLFAFIEHTLLFFAVRVVEGVGGAAISVATETMISRLSAPNERARRMSYYALSVGIGWAAGPLAGTLLFKVNHKLPFVGCFALSLLAGVLVRIWVPRTPSNRHRIQGLLRGLSVGMIIPIAAGALYGYLMSSLVTLFPLYLKTMHVGETAMGTIITAVIIGTIGSQVPIGRAADRFGRVRVLLICSILLTAVFLIMPLHTDWRSFVITGALAGALAGSLYPIGISIIGGLVSRDRLGAGTSLFSLAFGVGSLVGPGASGLAMNKLAPASLFYLPCLLTGLFCVVIISLQKRSTAETS